MNVYAGTSGYSYKEWKGSFYPEDSKPDGWLAYYATRLPCVEINNTFYRLPRKEMIRSWESSVPASFRFVVKATQRITHFKRLLGVDDEIEYLFTNLELLGDKLGPVLFQLPPNFKKDLPRLQQFLMQLPRSRRVSIQFSHPSWHEPDVFAALRGENIAFCTTDDPEKESPLESTADWGYLRLRREEYTPAELDDWAARLAPLGWKDAFVFFKHKEAAPERALAFLQRFAA